MPRAAKRTVAQAWIELIADDPEAISAEAVARARLTAARGLRSLRRLRLIELAGPLPELPALEELLHRSTQFYNPNKERAFVRLRAEDPGPPAAGEQAVLVSERGGERRPAAERWWHHETGRAIEVREGIAWLLGFEPGRGGLAAAEELVVLKDRRRGLLCNPISQEARFAPGVVPLPWWSMVPRTGNESA